MRPFAQELAREHASRRLRGVAAAAKSPDPPSTVARRLTAAGFFPWGHDAWIHGNDEGTVMSTDDALARCDDGR